MLFTKFISIFFLCYGAYYFFVLIADLIKSAAPVGADRASLHRVEYELPERPKIESLKVTEGKDYAAPGVTSLIQPPEERNRTAEESLSGERGITAGFDLDEERKSVFNLQHEQLSEGIEIDPENFSTLYTFI